MTDITYATIITHTTNHRDPPMPTVLILEAFKQDGKAFRVNDLDRPGTQPILAHEDARRPFAVVFPDQNTARLASEILSHHMQNRDTRHALLVEDYRKTRMSNAKYYIPSLTDQELPYVAIYPIPPRKWVTQSDYLTRQRAIQRAKEYILANESALPIFPHFPQTPLVVTTTEDAGYEAGLCMDSSAWDAIRKTDSDQQTFAEVFASRTHLTVFYGYEEDMDQFFQLPNHVIVAYALSNDLNNLSDAAMKHDPSDAGLYLDAAMHLQTLTITVSNTTETVESMLSKAHHWCAVNQLRPSHKARTHWIQGVLERAKSRKEKYQVPRIEPPIFAETAAYIQTASRYAGLVRVVVGSSDHNFIHGVPLLEDFHDFLKKTTEAIPQDLMISVVAVNGQSFFYKKHEAHTALRKQLKAMAEKTIAHKDYTAKALAESEQYRRAQAVIQAEKERLAQAEKERLEQAKFTQLPPTTTTMSNHL